MYMKYGITFYIIQHDIFSLIIMTSIIKEHSKYNNK